MNRFDDDFGIRHRRRVQCCSAPGDIDRYSRKINDTAVATIATEIVSSTHKNAVNWTWLDTQGAKHALGVVNGVSSDFETSATFGTFFINVDAIDRTCFRTLVACNASRQIKPMKATIAICDRNGKFGVFEVLSKRLPFRIISSKPTTQRDIKSVGHRKHGGEHIPKPFPHHIPVWYCCNWLVRTAIVQSP